MIALDNRQAVIVSVSEQTNSEDRVVITLTPDNCVLALTAQQARVLSTQIIQAVQRVEVKTSLAQPRQAMRRNQISPMRNMDNVLLVK
ncbi:hypothetical protein ACFDAU_15825 [Sulfuriferula sp. GW1]|uniref:hypothetical protein n=1 Tax=Sulfuriferula sp. GW1 TaxID=3345111 RepID=UPI0039B0ECA5